MTTPSLAADRAAPPVPNVARSAILWPIAAAAALGMALGSSSALLAPVRFTTLRTTPDTA